MTDTHMERWRAARKAESELWLKDLMGTSVSVLREHFEEVSGNWNGDDPRGEDKATNARDIVEKIDELKELLEESLDY